MAVEGREGGAELRTLCRPPALDGFAEPFARDKGYPQRGKEAFPEGELSEQSQRRGNADQGPGSARAILRVGSRDRCLAQASKAFFLSLNRSKPERFLSTNRATS